MKNLINFCCGDYEKNYLSNELVYIDNPDFYKKKINEIWKFIKSNINKNIFEEIIILTPKFKKLPIKNFILRLKIFNYFLDNNFFILEFYNIDINKIYNNYKNCEEIYLVKNSILFLKNKAIIWKDKINETKFDTNEISLFINKQLFYLNNLINYNNSFLLSININFLKNMIKNILIEIYWFLINFYEFTNEDFFIFIEFIKKYMNILDTLEFKIFKYDLDNDKNNDLYIDTDLLKCLKTYIYNTLENINLSDQIDIEIYILHFIYIFKEKIKTKKENYLVYNKLNLSLELILKNKNFTLENIKFPNFSILNKNKEIAKKKKKNRYKKNKIKKINFSNNSMLSTIKETSSLISSYNLI